MAKGETQKEFKERLRKERIGKINYNNYNEKMTIIEYNDAEHIVVLFENGCERNATYTSFKNGSIINIYSPTVYKVGYLGDGRYFKIDKYFSKTKIYECWQKMLQRCYDEKTIVKFPTYKYCTVCEEWHDFQNFAKWYNENYYEVDNERMCLDKDILVKENKIYSPETCIIVPESINILFIKCNKARGEYPIGVVKDKAKYRAYSSYLNKSNNHVVKTIGRYNTVEDAFYLGYKPFKEKVIKEMADKYKYQIPKELYNALYKYEVEITD